MKKIIFLSTLLVCFSAVQVLAETISEYLILQDIGRYKVDQPRQFWDEMIGGPKTGRSGNETEGYSIWFRVAYAGGDGYAAPRVTVSVYDSTQWLAHEVEEPFRDGEMETLGLLTDGIVLRKFDSNKVYMIAIGGETFRWLSGNILVEISHVDLQAEKPEPLEVVKAYLQKYPSTISLTDAQLKNQDHTKQWIKEEFDRLLWVSDRWVSLLQEADPKRAEKLKGATKNLEKFARYRRVYFKPLIGDPMEEDIDLLQSAHMRPELETIVRAKLAEYKEWWAAHKSESISLP